MSPFHKNKEYYSKTEWTTNKVGDELDAGLALLNKIDKKIVTFFGSVRSRETDSNYLHAHNLAFKLGKSGYAIITGGGSGILHAANKGARESGALSIGLRAQLLEKEHIHDPIYDHILSFHFIFVRRFIMSIKSEALVFYPGGFGTMNELFEYAMLMQTGILDTVPIVCVKKDFWRGFLSWFKKHSEKNRFLMHKGDLQLFHVADDPDEIIQIINKVK